jgi:hypothetical protein
LQQRAGSLPAALDIMRIFFCLLVVAVVGGFLAHRHAEEPAPVVAAQAPAPVQLQSPAPHENNPHNWMKNSLDRAADVKRQVIQQRKEDSAN